MYLNFRMTLTKASCARSSTFFQIDFDPDFNPIAKEKVDAKYRNRLILIFTVDTLPERDLTLLQNWMQSKWHEIPLDGQEAFFNLIVSFLQRQTVILGESGLFLANKV